jgi:nucleolar protein 14
MSLEDKLFQRFQHEKMKKVKKASKFSLDSSSATILTHGGKALGESTYNDQDWNESSDDENLASEAVSRLHFGGGLVETGKNVSDGDGISHKKTHADVLQEIVMKSKLFKLEKKEAKDAQEDQRELIDKAYDDLVGSALLDFKPMKRDRSELRDSSEGAGDHYDSILRSLAFESKVQASNRTESAEEIAKAERKKQEQLEGERVKRMKMDHLHLAPALSLPGKQSSHQLNDDCIYELYEDYTARNAGKDSVDAGMEAAYSDDESGDESEGFESLDEEEEEDEEEEDEEDEEDEEEGSEDGGSEDDAAEAESDEEVDESGEGDNVDVNSSATKPTKNEIPQTLDYPTSQFDFERMCSQYVGEDRAGDTKVLLDRISTVGSKDESAKMSYFKMLLNYAMKTGDALSTSTEQSTAAAMLSQVIIEFVNHIFP